MLNANEIGPDDARILLSVIDHSQASNLPPEDLRRFQNARLILGTVELQSADWQLKLVRRDA